MPDMGQFRVIGRLTGPEGDTMNVDMLVDTGATFLTLPRVLADRLKLRVRRMLPVQIAGGAEAMWPLADILVAVDDNEVPTLCLIAPAGEPLLGAVALESLVVVVDPVHRRLVPTKGYVLSA